MKTITKITSKGEGYTADVFDMEDGSYMFVGDMDMDWDGSPRWHEDPCGDPQTTLHHDGKPIDSWKVPGIVLPPELILIVKPMVIGCRAAVSYLNAAALAVVFDVGPHKKLGEGTPALAVLLGINPHYSHGGVDAPHVTYRWWPGVPAVVNGIYYQLQPYKSN